MGIIENLKKNREVLISWVIPILGIAMVLLKIILREKLSTDVLLSGLLGLFSFDILSINLLKKKENEILDKYKKTLDECKKIPDEYEKILDEIDRRLNIDSVFTTENEHEKSIIDNAQSELYVLQETGAQFAEDYKDNIRKFINNNGSLKIVICADDRTTISQLLLRNDSLRTYDRMKTRSIEFLERISGILKDNDLEQRAEKISVRYCPYPIGITLIIDDSKAEQAVVRWADFKVPYSDKKDLYITKKRNPNLYGFYLNQFNQYYYHSYKIILITGKPHAGKTTLFQKLSENTEQDYVFCLYSVEKLNEEGNGRTGFNAIMSNETNSPRQFATRDDGGEYNPNINVLDEIAINIQQSKKKIFIIDEIGPIQLKSNKFITAIENIFNDTTVTLFATIANEFKDNEREQQTIINSLKNNPRAFCIQYNDWKSQSDNILKGLRKELDASLNLYKILKIREN